MSTTWNAPHRSKVGQAMDAVEYAAETPNGGISAVGRNWYEITVTFHHGYAARAGEGKVATDLVALARLLFARGMTQWRRVRAEEGLVELPDTPRYRAWQDDRARMTVEGWSHDRSVHLACVGMSHWSAQLAPGTCARSRDVELSAAATQAARQLTEQWVTSLRELNRQHFWGPGS